MCKYISFSCFCNCQVFAFTESKANTGKLGARAILGQQHSSSEWETARKSQKDVMGGTIDCDYKEVGGFWLTSCWLQKMGEISLMHCKLSHPSVKLGRTFSMEICDLLLLQIVALFSTLYPPHCVTTVNKLAFEFLCLLLQYYSWRQCWNFHYF